ncbi:MAG: hypothetical protein N3B12_04480 [Armatimonadetes bacterium]|nr:hypothetical protein [Armatimonadota bacterium]
MSTTYLLALAHAAVIIIAFALTSRPVVSVYHWFLLTSLISFSLRPALAASVGGYTNYDSGVSWQAYNYGLLYQLVFFLSFSIAYILMCSTRTVAVNPIEKVVRPKAFYILLCLGLVAVCLLQLVSGGAWLPGARTGTINSAVPGGKYIFPIAVMAFSALIPFGVIAYMKRAGINIWMLVIAVAVSLTALSLLFMRGMVITGILLVLWALEKGGKLRFRHLIVGIAVFFLIGMMLRPMGKYVAVRYLLGEDDVSLTIAAASAAENLSLSDQVRAVLLYTTNLDDADSWPVVIDYVNVNGFQDGYSFLAIPARFASTRFRVESGYLTGTDIVNSFFYGANYQETSFGFHVSFANELFLNFGALGLFFGVFPGLLTWVADSWMRRVRLIAPLSLFVFSICFRGFTSEPAKTIQWAVGALALAFLVELLAGAKMRKPDQRLRCSTSLERATR